MSRRAKNTEQTGKNTKLDGRVCRRPKDASGADGLPANYWKACELARDGQYKKARGMYARLERSAAKADALVRTLVQYDLAAIAAMEGQLGEACQAWRAVLDGNTECLTARLNLGLVDAELSWTVRNLNSVEKSAGLVPGVEGGPGIEGGPTRVSALRGTGPRRCALPSL
jgi:hypothetical protein